MMGFSRVCAAGRHPDCYSPQFCIKSVIAPGNCTQECGACCSRCLLDWVGVHVAPLARGARCHSNGRPRIWLA